ncbi:MAG: hypothetical protein M1827_000349 [Pycnora praestabilis]|nr:MAG: hypothetical protein M1827_000349 [Pycnora praestabilis]
MATSVDDGSDPEAIVPYNMHVSARYLGLTKNKLELTRLPHEILLPKEREWEYGTPKSVLEPLVDFWLERYDWRAQETLINEHLPQFRTTINAENHPPLRIHFVHKRSPHPSAIPLLFCHGWPGSVLEVSKIIDPLTNPQETPREGMSAGREVQAFHVVAPSIPGFGFSDASTNDGMGLRATAGVYDTLMQRLGYPHYVAQGGDWGSNICRMLAIHHQLTCVATHVDHLNLRPPSLTHCPFLYLQYRLAHLTRCRVPFLRFGYIPSDFTHLLSVQPIYQHEDEETGYAHLQRTKPQTLAYALCDSPSGLLAYVREKLHAWSDNYAWTPVEILNFVMMHWLPGPEGGLRWYKEALPDMRDVREGKWSPTPMGVSVFPAARRGNGGGFVPPVWAKAVQRLGWVRRHESGGGFAAWERPNELVMDLRDFFGVLGRVDGRLRGRNGSEEVD